MILVFAWILIVVGVLAAIALIGYTEFGRDVSIPFSVVMIIIASLCIGFSIHMFLVANAS